MEDASAVTVLNVLFWFGWLLLLVCTFLIDHFDLFGLKQVWRYWREMPSELPKFMSRGRTVSCGILCIWDS